MRHEISPHGSALGSGAFDNLEFARDYQLLRPRMAEESIAGLADNEVDVLGLDPAPKAIVEQAVAGRQHELRANEGTCAIATTDAVGHIDPANSMPRPGCRLHRHALVLA